MHEVDKTAQHLQSTNGHPADSCTAFTTLVAVLAACEFRLACLRCVLARLRISIAQGCQVATGG